MNDLIQRLRWIEDSVQRLESAAQRAEARQVRIETRLVRLLQAHSLGPNGFPNEDTATTDTAKGTDT